jgi:hypothetical protein
MAIHVAFNEQDYGVKQQRLALLRWLADWHHWQQVEAVEAEQASTMTVERVLEDVEQENQSLRNYYEAARDMFRLEAVPYRGLQQEIMALRVGLGAGYAASVGVGVLVGVFVGLAITGPVGIMVVAGVSVGLLAALVGAGLFRVFASQLHTALSNKLEMLRNVGKPEFIDRRFWARRKPTPAGLVKPNHAMRNEAREQWGLFRRRECQLARKIECNRHRFLRSEAATDDLCFRLTVPAR